VFFSSLTKTTNIMYSKVIKKYKKPIEDLHTIQWHEYYTTIKGKTSNQKNLKKLYNNFILNEFSKNFILEK